MLDLLIAGDFKQCRRYWAERMPGMKQPESDEEAEIAMHIARTQSAIPTMLRLWSHKWLQERNLPSYLPEHLKDKADKLRPVRAEAVAIAVAAEPHLQQAANVIRRGMERSIAELFAESRGTPHYTLIQERLNESRKREFKKLFGTVDG